MSYGPSPSPFTQSALSADRAKKKRRTKVLAVVLAVVLCVGGGAFWAVADDDPEQVQKPTAARQAPDEIRDTVEKIPRTPEGSLAVDYNESDFKKRFKRDSAYAPGAWATDKNFVRGVGNTLKGFKFGTLEEDWSKELTGPICDTTRHVTADGRTAVLLQERAGKGAGDDKERKTDKSKNKKDKKKDKDKGADTDTNNPDQNACTQLAFFDLHTGKKLWQVKLPDAKGAFAPNTNVTMTRGTVAVAWGYGSVAYDMKRGRQLWSSPGTGECRDLGFAGGRDLLALAQCGDPAEPQFKVQKLRPRTGKSEWTYKVTRGVGRVYLVSSDPAVLAVTAGGITVTHLITLDDHGAYQATINMPEDRFLDNCYKPVVSGVETCDGIVVGKDQLFLATDEGRIADNWIVSYDLRTGKTVRKFDSKPDLPIHPIRVSGGKLLAYRPSSDDISPAAVLSLDPRTGKETPFLLFGMPDSGTKLEDPEQAEIIIEDGRVFFAPRELTAENGGPWEGMAYGALGIEGA